MSMTMTDSELRALMSEVQGELDSILKSEGKKLSKAHPGEETASEIPADESATSSDEGSETPAPAESAPADESAPPSGDEGESDAPPGAPGDAPPADPAQGSDPAMDGQAMDPEAIKAELAQLPMEHVKALYLAAKEVIFAQMGGAGGPPGAPGMDAGAPPVAPLSPEMGSAPPGSSPPGSPPMDPNAPPALKAEMKASTPADGDQKILGKSESAQIADLKKKVSDFEEITSKFMTVMEKAISVPARKAVTSIVDLAKSAPSAESLSKAEVNVRLDRAARTKLSKNDRALINQYSVGAIGVEGIRHLLDTK